MEGKWLSVLEYASFKKKSISTVRRYIKAERVKFKEENGKYFIWVKNFISNKMLEDKEQLTLKFEMESLKKENRELQEQISEAKMLIQLYENGQMLPQRNAMNLPNLPDII
jgi:hypothetical protein